MVAGRDLNACNEAELAAFRRTTIGFVFQSHHLLPQLSVVENVLVPLLAEPSLVTDGSLENRAEQLLDRVGLSHRLDHRPGQLSGGERQGVVIARAMYFKSKFLILDEPTNHLSIKETNKVLDFVAGLKDQGVTSIFITHNLNHVFPIADHLCVMARGEKIADLQKENTDIQELTNLLVNG